MGYYIYFLKISLLNIIYNVSFHANGLDLWLKEGDLQVGGCQF